MKFFSTPAWSFGTKAESQLFKGNEAIPGPGTYELRPEDIIVPSTKFGQSSRPELFQKSTVPGPPPAPEIKPKETKSTKSLKPTHFKDKIEKSKVSQPDRPNDDPKKPKTTISYSFGNKVYAIQGPVSEEIGPGQYDPNFKAIQSSRGTTFGVLSSSKSRVPLSSTGPGPGAYEIKTTRASSVSFAKSKRDNNIKNSNPGPDYYAINRELNTNGKSLTSRRPLPGNKTLVPGPGTYDLKSSMSYSTFPVVSGKRTNFIQPGNNPGPGEYDPNTRSEKGISFTKGLRPGAIEEKKQTLLKMTEKEQLERRGLIVKEKCHGKIEIIDEEEAEKLEDEKMLEKKGQYFETMGEGPKISFSGRRIQPKVIATPGPGHYEKPETDGKGVKIGTGVRSGDLRSFKNKNPGPGSYSHQYLPKTSPGGWTFGKDPRSRIIDDDEPGPGHYDIPPVIPDVPKYLILQSNLNLND